MKFWKVFLVIGIFALLFVFAGCITNTVTPETSTPTATVTSTPTEVPTPEQAVNVIAVPEFIVLVDPDGDGVYSSNTDGYINKEEASHTVILWGQGEQPTNATVEVYLNGELLGQTDVVNGAWRYDIEPGAWGEDGEKTISVRYVYKGRTASNYYTVPLILDTIPPTLTSASIVGGREGGVSTSGWDAAHWTTGVTLLESTLTPPPVLWFVDVEVVDKTLLQDAAWSFSIYKSGNDYILKITKTDAAGVAIQSKEYNLSQALAVNGDVYGGGGNIHSVLLEHTIMQGVRLIVQWSTAATVYNTLQYIYTRKPKPGYIEATFDEEVKAVVEGTDGEYHPAIGVTTNIQGAAYHVVSDNNEDGNLDTDWTQDPKIEDSSVNATTVKWIENDDTNYLYGMSGKYYIIDFSFEDKAGNKNTAKIYGYVKTQ